MKTKSILLLGSLLLLLPLTATAQHTDDIKVPEAWKSLVKGGRFMDRLEPLPILSKRTSDTWGEDAVKPRDITLGIEDPDWTYFGGNIIKGKDGKYHQFVCRWAENSPKGHMSWFDAETVHAVSDSHLGPFIAKEVLGKGFNPEAYQLSKHAFIEKWGIMEVCVQQRGR